VTDEDFRVYRDRIIFGPFTDPDPDDLAELESVVGVRLPTPYREFLQVANGGRLDYAVRLPAEAGGEILTFWELYRLGAGEPGMKGFGTLLGEYGTRNELWISEFTSLQHMLPIADDSSSNLLCLDLDPKTRGRVVAFIYGLPAWTGLTQHDVGAVVGDSFNAYLDGLFIDEDSARYEWETAQHPSVSAQRRDAVRRWLDQGLPDWRTRPWAT
jgi:hypothetical protein